MADGYATNFRAATICPPSLHTLRFVRIAPAPQRGCWLCSALTTAPFRQHRFCGPASN
jgi:hypothetical protein